MTAPTKIIIENHRHYPEHNMSIPDGINEIVENYFCKNIANYINKTV